MLLGALLFGGLGLIAWACVVIGDDIARDYYDWDSAANYYEGDPVYRMSDADWAALKRHFRHAPPDCPCWSCRRHAASVEAAPTSEATAGGKTHANG